ncbi:tropomyosin-like [Gossypium hirsutum]|uniref:Tropomyosin-like n=1 Tax=Gossypium hirsutum TaxID=3635 RepID=A0ABM3A9K9_GOSHI|nr:tropomyosin-like [Gossypium hirsutum]
MHLRLDADVQKLEVEKLEKGNNKVEEDLDSLKTDYKKLRVSMRTARLGKTSEQWRQEIQEERNKADQLKARIVELERSLARYRGRNSMIELKASLCKIEEMKKRIEELENTLQNCGQRIEFLEGNEEHWKEQLYHSQNQIQNGDYIMDKAMAQIGEVADHLQTMAIQADVLSVKYELESDRGQELASLLKEVKALSIRAGSSSNLGDNLNNIAIPDFDEIAEKDKAKEEFLKQLREMRKWVLIRAMGSDSRIAKRKEFDSGTEKRESNES